MAKSAAWNSDLVTTATWNSNATNSDRAADEIGALQLHAAFHASYRFSLGGDDTLFLGGEWGAENWPRFDGLDRVHLGPSAAWQHKFGLGAMAPVLRVDLGADGVAAREHDRAGLAASGMISWRQRIDESTRWTLSYERTRHDASNPVFDRTGGEASAEMARDFAEVWQVSLAARWREGDVLSYATPPRPDIVALARVRTAVTTFDQPRVAYSLDARTLGGAFTLVRTLGESTSLTLGYEYRRSEHGALDYVNHLVSLALAHQF